MKKALSVFLALIMVFSAVPFTDLSEYIRGIDFSFLAPKASAASNSGPCGDNVNWSLDTKTGVLTISGSGAMYDYSPYSSSESPWHSYMGGIKSVVIENGVTNIGEYAFRNCGNLTSFTIPNSVISIGDYAFSDCRSIRSVTIGDNVKSIGECAFNNCGALGSVTIEDSVTSIGNDAFGGCKSLIQINVSEDNEYYSSVNGVLFNKDKTEIICFPRAKKDSFIIPNSVTSIGDRDFYYCNLSDVTIPNSITSIGDEAFYHCDNLTNIIIKDSVKSIGDKAFYYCSNLKSITIGNGVKNIGENAFFYCSALTSINVSADNEYYSSVDGVLFNKDQTELICYFGEKTDSYTIPDNVTSIVAGAFFGHASFTSITMPCVYGGYLGYIFGVSSYSYNSSYVPSSLKTVILTDKCTEIPENAFYGCNSLTGVTIPESVTDIGDYAFCNCSSLTDITIPNSVKSIGKNTFYDCDSLTSVTIPDSVTSIGNYAFYDCDSLTSITIGNNVTSIGEYTFYDCDSLTNTVIGNSVNSIGSFAFYDCDSLTGITIPDSVTNIGMYAFADCSNLTSITIGNNVTSIGNDAFSNCESLTSAVIPDSVTNIGRYAFAFCKKLTSITIPDSVTNIGERAFTDCDSLTSVVIGNGVKNMSVNAFGHCSALTAINVSADNEYYSSVDGVLFNKDKTELICCPGGKSCTYTIPDRVTSIGNEAFSGCESLTNLIIPESVMSIGIRAFQSCYNLSSITIFDNVTSIGERAFSATEYWRDSSNWEDGVLYIGNHLLEAKTDISGAYTVKSGTKTIADYAFVKCDGLTSITIPDSVTNIGKYAFYNCSNLTSVIISESVTSIGGSAFYNCDSLAGITIPGRVTSIGGSAFQYCDSLTVINVSADNEDYSSVDGVLFNKDKTELICCPGGKSGTYTIPDSVTSIGNYAFGGCNSLTSVTIPDSVTSIDKNAFPADCTVKCSCTSVFADEYTVAFHNSYKSKITTQPTCTTDGVKLNKCINCGYTYEETVPMLSHSYGDWYVTKKPTCISTGAETRVCSYCKETETRTLEILPHQMRESQIASCSEKCCTHHLCTACGYSYDDNFTEEREHVFENGKCKFCNLNENDFFESDHDYLINKTYTWTITKPGADGILIKFSSKTAVEDIFDTITVKGSGDTAAQTFTGTELSYETVTVNGDTATVILESDESGTDYGVYITKVTPVYNTVSVENGLIDHSERVVLTHTKQCMSVTDLLTLPEPFGASVVPVSGNLLGTGSVVTLSYDGEKIGDYTVVIEGDLNGDGVCDVLDIALTEKTVNSHTELTKAQAYAANGDVNEDITISTYQNIVNSVLSE